MKTIRVASLNLWNKSGPWPARKNLICAELLRQDPDVLGLQELLRVVPPAPAAAGAPLTKTEAQPRGADAGSPTEPWAWGPENDQLTELAGAFQDAGGQPRGLAFVEARSFGGGLVMGNGVMTRFPFVDVQGFPLPGEESGETRSLLYVLLDTPAGRLPVFVTHLNWKWDHGSVRVRQVRAVVETIESLHPLGAHPEEGVLPPVLMGDFNAEPDSDEIRFLRGLHTLEGKSVHFADTWQWAGDGTAGHTFDRTNGFAARSSEPPRRIDYIFVRGPDAWLRGEPTSAHLAFDVPAAGRPDGSSGQVWPSDHYGLVADLAVERRASP